MRITNKSKAYHNVDVVSDKRYKKGFRIVSTSTVKLSIFIILYGKHINNFKDFRSFIEGAQL